MPLGYQSMHHHLDGLRAQEGGADCSMVSVQGCDGTPHAAISPDGPLLVL